MSEPGKKTIFHVETGRADAHGSVAHCKAADITLDTALAGRTDALNLPELLLAALSACIIKGIERVTPILKFSLRGVEVRMEGVRQDMPPKLESITYEIIVDSDESDHCMMLLHENVKKYGTVFNTIAPGARLFGGLHRKHMPCLHPADLPRLWLCRATEGWQLMTPAVRTKHQAKMRSFKTYDECKAYQKTSQADGGTCQEKGMTPPPWVLATSATT
jgi:uncharacterized OsmC-like protein